MDVRETVCKAPLRRGFLLPAKKSGRRLRGIHHVLQQRAQQRYGRLLALYVAAHQPHFQRHPRFTQGFPQQCFAVVFILGAPRQYGGKFGMGQAVENPHHGIQFRLHLRSSPKVG